MRRFSWLVNNFPLLARVALVTGLLSLIHPPYTLIVLGEQKHVVTRNTLAGVHTRFVDEADAWKIQRGLSMIREIGALWIVEFFPWAYYEKRKGVFDWSSADRIVDHANRQGLKVIARLGYVPEWARPKFRADGSPTTFTHLDPQNHSDFADYAAAFASHFKGRVQHIIIWNEPNLNIEWGLRRVDPAAYVELLRSAFPTIKKANPEIIVLVGALAPTLEKNRDVALSDLVYLDEMYRAMGDERPYDGWAGHNYGQTSPPEEAPSQEKINFRRVELLRKVMLKNGDADKPIFITETGWNDDPRYTNGVSPAQRIDYTLRAFEYAKANWLWAKCVAIWVFKLPAPAKGYRDRFTFVTPSLEPLPIYEEVKRNLRGD
jgi:hypothetical protein